MFELTVVVVPDTVKSPVTVRLSLTVVSDVVCPIDTVSYTHLTLPTKA